jgi:hypothetical protein
MRLLRPLASASLALFVALTPRLASAYFPFPGYVQTHLMLSYVPQCTICHNSDNGGLPVTLTEPFGKAMLAQGLAFTSTEAEVDAALDALAKAKTDSDCNGIPDITQLEDGRDPNPPGEYIDGSGKPNPDDEPDGGCPQEADAGAEVPQPAYGCGAQLSPAAPSWEGSVAAGLVAALGLALVRRPRRAHR